MRSVLLALTRPAEAPSAAGAEPDENYTWSFFTNHARRVIVSAEIRAMPGKDKEMIRFQVVSMAKNEYLELSLCSYEYKQHGFLSRPYKTLNAENGSLRPV